MYINPVRVPCPHTNIPLKKTGGVDEKEKIPLKPIYENHLPLLPLLSFLLINIAEHKRRQLLIEDKPEIS